MRFCRVFVVVLIVHFIGATSWEKTDDLENRCGATLHKKFGDLRGRIGTVSSGLAPKVQKVSVETLTIVQQSTISVSVLLDFQKTISGSMKSILDSLATFSVLFSLSANFGEGVTKVSSAIISLQTSIDLLLKINIDTSSNVTNTDVQAIEAAAVNMAGDLAAVNVAILDVSVALYPTITAVNSELLASLTAVYAFVLQIVYNVYFVQSNLVTAESGAVSQLLLNTQTATFVPLLNVVNTLDQMTGDINEWNAGAIYNVLSFVVSNVHSGFKAALNSISTSVTVTTDFSGFISTLKLGPIAAISTVLTASIKNVSSMAFGLTKVTATTASDSLGQFASGLDVEFVALLKATRTITATAEPDLITVVGTVHVAYPYLQSSLIDFVTTIGSLQAKHRDTTALKTIEGVAARVFSAIQGFTTAVFNVIAAAAAGLVNIAGAILSASLTFVLATVLNLAYIVVYAIASLIFVLFGVASTLVYTIATALSVTLTSVTQISVGSSGIFSEKSIDIKFYLQGLSSSMNSVTATVTNKASEVVNTVGPVIDSSEKPITWALAGALTRLAKTSVGYVASASITSVTQINVITLKFTSVTAQNVVTNVQDLDAAFIVAFKNVCDTQITSVAKLIDATFISSAVTPTFYEVEFSVRSILEYIISLTGTISPLAVTTIDTIVVKLAGSIKAFMSAAFATVKSAASFVTTLVGRFIVSFIILVGSTLKIVNDILVGIHALIKILTGVASEVLHGLGVTLIGGLSNLAGLLADVSGVVEGDDNSAVSSFLEQSVTGFALINSNTASSVGAMIQGYGSVTVSVDWALSVMLSGLLSGSLTIAATTVNSVVYNIDVVVRLLTTSTLKSSLLVWQKVISSIVTSFASLNDASPSIFGNSGDEFTSVTKEYVTGVRDIELSLHELIRITIASSESWTRTSLQAIEGAVLTIGKAFAALAKIIASVVKDITTTAATAAIVIFITSLAIVFASVLQIVFSITSALATVIFGFFGVASKVLNGFNSQLSITLLSISGGLRTVSIVLVSGKLNAFNAFIGETKTTFATISTAALASVQILAQDVVSVTPIVSWALSGISDELLNGPIGYVATGIGTVVNVIFKITVTSASITLPTATSVLEQNSNGISSAFVSVDDLLLKIFTDMDDSMSSSSKSVSLVVSDVRTNLIALVQSIITASADSFAPSSNVNIEGAAAKLAFSIRALITEIVTVTHTAATIVTTPVVKFITSLIATVTSVLQVTYNVVTSMYVVYKTLANISNSILYGLGSTLARVLADVSGVFSGVAIILTSEESTSMSGYLVQVNAGFATIGASLAFNLKSLLRTMVGVDVTVTWSLSSFVANFQNGPMGSIASTVDVSVGIFFSLSVALATVTARTSLLVLNNVIATLSISFGAIVKLLPDIFSNVTASLSPYTTAVPTAFDNVVIAASTLLKVVVSGAASMTSSDIEKIEGSVIELGNAVLSLIGAVVKVVQAATIIATAEVVLLSTSLTFVLVSVLQIVSYLVHGLFGFVNGVAGVASKVIFDLDVTLTGSLTSVSVVLNGANNSIASGTSTDDQVTFLAQMNGSLVTVLGFGTASLRLIGKSVGLIVGTATWPLSALLNNLLNGHIGVIGSTLNTAISRMITITITFSSATASTALTVLHSMSTTINISFDLMISTMPSIVWNQSGALISQVNALSDGAANVKIEAQALIDYIISVSASLTGDGVIWKIENLAFALVAAVQAMTVTFSKVTKTSKSIVTVASAELVAALYFVYGAVLQAASTILAGVSALLKALNGVASTVLTRLDVLLTAALKNIADTLKDIESVLSGSTSAIAGFLNQAHYVVVTLSIKLTISTSLTTVNNSVSFGRYAWPLGDAISSIKQSKITSFGATANTAVYAVYTVSNSFSNVNQQSAFASMQSLNSAVTVAFGNIGAAYVTLFVGASPELKSFDQTVAKAVSDVQFALINVLRIILSGIGNLDNAVMAATEKAMLRLASAIYDLSVVISKVAQAAVSNVNTANASFIASLTILYGSILQISRNVASGSNVLIVVFSGKSSKIFLDFDVTIVGTTLNVSALLRDVSSIFEGNGSPKVFIQQVNTGFVSIVTGLATTLTLFEQSHGALVGTVSWALTGVFTGLYSTPIGMLATSVNSAVSGVYKISIDLGGANSRTVISVVSKLRASLSDSFGLIKNMQTTVVSKATGKLMTLSNDVAVSVEDVKESSNTLLLIFSSMVTATNTKNIDRLDSAGTTLGKRIEKLTTEVLKLTKAAESTVTDAVALLIASVTAILASVAQIVLYIVTGLLAFMKAFFAGVTSKVLTALKVTLATKLKGITSTLSSLPGLFDGSVGGAANFLSNVSSGLKTVLNGLLFGLSNLVTGVGNIFGGTGKLLTGLLGGIFGKSLTLSDVLKTSITDVTETTNSLAVSDVRSQASLVRKLRKTVSSSFKSYAEGITVATKGADTVLIQYTYSYREIVLNVQVSIEECLQTFSRSSSMLDASAIQDIEFANMRVVALVQALTAAASKAITFASSSETDSRGKLVATLALVLGTVLQNVIDITNSIYAHMLQVTGHRSSVLLALLSSLTPASESVHDVLLSANNILQGSSSDHIATIHDISAAIDHITLTITASMDSTIRGVSSVSYDINTPLTLVMSILTGGSIGIVSTTLNTVTTQVTVLASQCIFATSVNADVVLKSVSESSQSIFKILAKLTVSFNWNSTVKTAVGRVTDSLIDVGKAVEAFIQSVIATVSSNSSRSSIHYLESNSLKMADSVEDIIKVLSKISGNFDVAKLDFIIALTAIVASVVQIVQNISNGSASLVLTTNKSENMVLSGVVNKVSIHLASISKVMVDIMKDDDNSLCFENLVQNIGAIVSTLDSDNISTPISDSLFD